MSYKGKVVTLLGLASVQRYLFASNRLKENAGASYLAWHATEQWRSNPRGGELLYTGGGNAALVFASAAKAEAAVKAWSRELLKKAPGLRPTAAIVEISGGLRPAFGQAQRQLLLNENGAPFGADLGALPVIIVGQLQHEGKIPYSHNREMLERVRNEIVGSVLTDGWGHTPGPGDQETAVPCDRSSRIEIAFSHCSRSNST